MITDCLRRSQRRDAGIVTAYTVILTVAVLAFAGLVLDAGLAIATKVKAVEIAQAAARAGARELDVSALRNTGVIRLNPAQAQTSAQQWIARCGVTGTVRVAGNQVTVTVNTSRKTQLLQLVGIGSLRITAQATATAVEP